MTTQDYSPLISTIKKKLSSWTARHLSFAGRLQLLGSVIYSIVNFWMSAYRLPRKCIQEINSMCSAFLWSGPVLSTHKAKLAWENVCKPKDEGGLGLKNLSDANKVSCLKLIWRIISGRPSLWVKWVWKYLIRKGSLWSVSGRSTLGSWMWKKLLKSRLLAMHLARMMIKSGSNTSFWYDRWSHLGRLIDMTGERGPMDLGIPINSSVELAAQLYRVKVHRNPTLKLINQEIVRLRNRGLTQEDDVCLWKRENGDFKEDFNTSQTWSIIRDQTLKVTWFKGVWFAEATPKFSFILWLAMQNRLATGDRVVLWNPQASVTCSLCKAETESRDYLIFECAYAREAWCGTIKNIPGARIPYRWSEVVQIVVNGLRGKTHTFLMRYCFQAVVYTLWHERNRRRVDEQSLPVACFISRLDKLIRNIITSFRRKYGGKHEKAMQIWFGRI